MLMRSDITIQQVDVTKAYDLMAMFKEAGKEDCHLCQARLMFINLENY